jgi:hypothetical protein
VPYPGSESYIFNPRPLSSSKGETINTAPFDCTLVCAQDKRVSRYIPILFKLNETISVHFEFNIKRGLKTTPKEQR